MALSLRMGLVFAGLAAIVLVVFYVGVFATGSFDVDKLFDVQPVEGNLDWFRMGGPVSLGPCLLLSGSILRLNGYRWLQKKVTMPSKTCHERDSWNVYTVWTFIIYFGVKHRVVGASALGDSEALADGFQVVFGIGSTATLTLMALVGLIASFHAIIYA